MQVSSLDRGHQNEAIRLAFCSPPPRMSPKGKLGCLQNLAPLATQQAPCTIADKDAADSG